MLIKNNIDTNIIDIINPFIIPFASIIGIDIKNEPLNTANAIQK